MMFIREITLLFLVGKFLFSSTQSNVALNKFAGQSSTFSTFTADLGVDGDTSTCSHITPVSIEPWWYVDLGNVYSVNYMQIYKIGYETGLIDVEVRVTDVVSTILTSNSICGTISSQTPVDGDYYQIDCNPSLTGRYVSLARTGTSSLALTLCDVQVWVNNACAASSCLNSGTCVTGINSYSCMCPDGYAGNLCEFNVNECASSPCMNNGNCNDNINFYTCTCAEGFDGIRCETFNECSSSPCMNSGACVDGTNTYACVCQEGFSGIHCESTWYIPSLNMIGLLLQRHHAAGDSLLATTRYWRIMKCAASRCMERQTCSVPYPVFIMKCAASRSVKRAVYILYSSPGS